MRRPYLFIQFLVILSLGLISCSSDQQSEQSEPKSKLSVEIRNSDETIQKIQKTKSLRISSFISLSDDEIPLRYSKVTTLTTCRTNRLQGVVEKVSEHQNVSELAVKDVVPSLVFTPSENPAQVSCSLDINMSDGNHEDVRIRIVDVQILNIANFHNYEIDFLRSDNNKPLYFHHSDIVSRSFSWPLTEGTVETLCSDRRSQTLLFGEPKSAAEYFPESLFLDQNLQQCRLVFESKDSTWVTQKFFVQRHPSNLNAHVESYLQGTDAIDYQNEPILKYTIRNQGVAVAFVKITTPATEVTLIPIFSRFPNSMFQTEVISLGATWQVLGLRAESKDSESSTPVYQIKPGEQVELVLFANGAFQCPAGNPPDSTQRLLRSSGCNDPFIQVKMGYRFGFKKLPSFVESEYEGLGLNQWKAPVSLQLASRYKIGSTHYLWKDSEKFNARCPSLGGQKPKDGEAYQTLRQSLRNLFYCKPF